MATSPTTTTTVLLLLIITISTVCFISTTARPCKTIFFITSSSSSSFTQNPNLPIQNPNSPRFTFFITEIHQFHRTRSVFPDPISSNDAVSSKPRFSDSSVRDRAMDVISIVGALLFGVGCGALTAGTMYLVWSVFSTRRVDFDDSDDEEEFDDVEGDVEGVNGYVAVASDVKDVPPSADEVDAMKK